MKIQVKHLTFEEHEINALCEAIILAQDSLGDKRSFGKTNNWDAEITQKISVLDAILKSVYTTEYRELQEPPETDNSMYNQQQQSLPFSDI
jgi:hypothetical protein